MSVFSSTVYFTLTNYNGDIAGNVFGNFSLSKNADGSTPFSNVSVTAKLVAGHDVISTLEAALAARQDLPTLTAVTPAV